MVLVAVLWVLLLLSLLAASYALTVRTSVALARNAVGSAEAEALASAGIHRAMAGLVASIDPPLFRLDGTPYGWGFADGEVRFTIADEGGKIDLNAARPELLSALFQTVGMRAKEADSLAAAIDTYRKRVNGEEEGQTSEPSGDEPADGQSTGALPGSADRSLAFALVEEVLRVPGFSGDLYHLVAPSLTVYSGSDQPDETNAPPDVAMALHMVEAGSAGGGAGAKQAELRARLDERRSRLGAAVRSRESESLGGGAASAGSPRSLLGGSNSEGTAGNGTVLIHAEAMTAGGSVFVREAVIRISLEQSPPYVVLAWRQGARWLFPLDEGAAG